MKKYLITDEKLTDIGDAIREKTGKTDLIPVEQMDEEIRSIQVGVDTSDATAAPGELLVGKTAYVNEQKITGTMENRGAVSQALNAGGSYTIPVGYHDGNGKITANSLASQTDATAVAGDIVKGKTAYVNGVKVTGNIYETTGDRTISMNASNPYKNGDNLHVTSEAFSSDRVCREGVKIEIDTPLSGLGDATAADVASSKTFTSASGVKVSGTRTLAGETSANAAAGDIRSGKTAWVNGSKVTGTLVVPSGLMLKNTGIRLCSRSDYGDQRFYHNIQASEMQISKGYYTLDDYCNVTEGKVYFLIWNNKIVGYGIARYDGCLDYYPCGDFTENEYSVDIELYDIWLYTL